MGGRSHWDWCCLSALTRFYSASIKVTSVFGAVVAMVVDPIAGVLTVAWLVRSTFPQNLCLVRQRW